MRLSVKMKKIYVGDIFIGCHSCQIQKRHFGEAPTWAGEKDIIWVSEKAERLAKTSWKQEKQNSSNQELK